jgi:putative flippase GtrA
MRYSTKFMHFAIAGGVGFVVDTTVLYALMGLLGPYGARLVSFVCAVATTWLINRSFAFKAERASVPVWREFLHYLSAMILGGGVNYAVFALLVAVSPFVGNNPVFGVAVGAMAGMQVNYLVADRWVFGRKAG